MAAPDIGRFDFGQTKHFALPLQEPPSSPALVYTAWHIWRALEYHKRDIRAGSTIYTLRPIWRAFQVNSPPTRGVVQASAPALPTDVEKELRAVRPIQPFRQTKNRPMKYVSIPPPLKPREQAALLLYVLLPGEEGEKCSCCEAYDGSGPFRLCIAGSEEHTGGACLNCYYTGTSSKCDLRKGEPARLDYRAQLTLAEHEAARLREQEKKLEGRRRFVPGAEKTADAVEIGPLMAVLELPSA